MESPDGTDASPRLALTIDNSLVPRFYIFLQLGVMVGARVGCSVQVFLSQELGLHTDAVDKIQSIFLDGKPVDDLNTATIRDGSVLALSAAMPGLVGATLRRGGAYSSFRNTITYHEEGAHAVSGEGLVQIKIFNLLMNELGPGLLKRGVFVKCSALMTFLAEQAPDFWQGCRRAFLDGRPVWPQALAGEMQVSGRDRVFISVSTEDRKT